MAERIVHQLIDDIDGTEIHEGAGERIEFSLRGVRYHIDLSTANVAKLDKAFKPYIEAAVQVRGSGRARGSSTRGRGKKKPPAALSTIREWARKNGHEVADRGRIKAEIVDAYEATH